MNNNMNKLYEFTARLIEMLEEDLEVIKNQRSKTKSAKTRSNIVNVLSKLVSMLLKLKKMDNGKKVISNLDKSDQDIIENFLSKYRDSTSFNSVTSKHDK